MNDAHRTARLTWRRASAAAVCLVIAGAALPAWAQGTETPDIVAMAGFVRWIGVVLSVFVIIGAVLVLRFLSGTAERLSARFVHRRLLIHKVESFARFSIYIGTAVLVLGLSFRLDKTALTVIGGGLAFAVGFAMRDLIAAVIAGITIMFDRPFQVGDRVSYAGQYGDIIQIGLRSVRMRTLDDNIVTIPNNKILTDVTSNGNYGALTMQVEMDFFVGIDQDIAQAERLVTEAILTSRYVFLEKPAEVLVEQLIQGDYVAVRLRGKAYVLDTKYEKALVSDVNRRLLVAFREHEIQPPAILHRHVDAGRGCTLDHAALTAGATTTDAPS